MRKNKMLLILFFIFSKYNTFSQIVNVYINGKLDSVQMLKLDSIKDFYISHLRYKEVTFQYLNSTPHTFSTKNRDKKEWYNTWLLSCLNDKSSKIFSDCNSFVSYFSSQLKDFPDREIFDECSQCSSSLSFNNFSSFYNHIQKSYTKKKMPLVIFLNLKSKEEKPFSIAKTAFKMPVLTTPLNDGETVSICQIDQKPCYYFYLSGDTSSDLHLIVSNSTDDTIQTSEDNPIKFYKIDKINSSSFQILIACDEVTKYSKDDCFSRPHTIYFEYFDKVIGNFFKTRKVKINFEIYNPSNQTKYATCIN